MTTKQPMTDAELENHIAYCGHQIERCMRSFRKTNDAKDREKAEAWRQDMQHAIAQRSPKRIAEMEAAVATPGTAPCYFTEQGELDREKSSMFHRKEAA